MWRSQEMNSVFSMCSALKVSLSNNLGNRNLHYDNVLLF